MPGPSGATDLQGAQDDPVLKRIFINSDSIIKTDELNKEQLVLDFRHHNIAFDLEGAESNVYQYLLKGYDKSWSSWHELGYKEYTNLPPGKYYFNVRYFTGSKTGELILFQFKVLPLWYFSFIAIILYVCLAALVYWFLYATQNLRFARTQHMLEQIINKRTEDLIVEKEKSETLLANVLPKNTASEIMEKGKATKIKYNFVTVLFSDIQGFTKIAEETNPEVLIDELDKFFFYFDSVVERLGIEKIKTIGDAYMCAGGIPEKNRTNPVEVILAALEMQVYMSRLKETSELEGMKFWDIRIGIHTGTVVAGVVGQKKLSYDIWGDTVNTASRMESSGEAGKINISGTTYEFVKEFFVCEHRGRMPVKYKGELDMYFVNGIVPELRDEDGRPNKKFILKMQMIKLQDIEELIIKMFDDEAPPDLYFHNSSLMKSVSNQAELLATAEKISEEEFVTLKLASIFLLTGYINDYDKPLEASFSTAEEILPRYGFDLDSINEVKRIIQNSFSNKQENTTDNILHDARYDYMGRVDYIKLTDKLLREESEYGKSHSRKEWIDIQRKLLIDHEFITKTGNLLRSVQVEDQIVALQESTE
ncbi:MAG: triple tyrosine motif-containing protein [Bacteroidia bacterium]|nr:triple tyrosine motif-containing protein [Bacteroidia bacterium]